LFSQHRLVGPRTEMRWRGKTHHFDVQQRKKHRPFVVRRKYYRVTAGVMRHVFFLIEPDAGDAGFTADANGEAGALSFFLFLSAFGFFFSRLLLCCRLAMSSSTSYAGVRSPD